MVVLTVRLCLKGGLKLYSEPQLLIFHSWRCSSWVSMSLRISRDWSTVSLPVMLLHNILDAGLSQGVQKVVFGTLLSGFMCGKHIISIVFAALKLSISVWRICLLYFRHSRHGNSAVNDVQKTGSWRSCNRVDVQSARALWILSSSCLLGNFVAGTQ